MASVRYRFVWPVVLITICLVSLCAFTAVSLFYQQAATTQALRENVSSSRAASDLRGCLNVLIALERNRVESVADLHARAAVFLQEIHRHTDQPNEQAISAAMDAGFAEYLARWQALPPPDDPAHAPAVVEATRFLESHVLEPCREFEEFNDARIEDSTRHLERVLGQLAWGMAGVGALGGVAGLVFGFGMARGLSRSIRRLQVQIRDAAGKLGGDLPEIVLTGDGDFRGLHEQVDRLSARIEAVVGQLRQRDREVLRAEQLAAVGQLAAGVAHEIRNPLTSIKMLVQAAQEDGAGGLTGEDLRVIEGEVRRQERSLQTFLDFARPSKLHRRPVEVVGIVHSVLGLVRGRCDKQQVRVRLDTPPGGLTLTADPDQLQQVLVNLALNALDAMPSGGTLGVAVRRRDGAAEVEVSDTGPGVPKGIMPRLFEPFVSGKETGLGLGLVITKRIAEDHGGSLAAVNRPGGGASFVLRLPPGTTDADAVGR
jgi:signal transduction histidine kinase